VSHPITAIQRRNSSITKRRKSPKYQIKKGEKSRKIGKNSHPDFKIRKKSGKRNLNAKKWEKSRKVGKQRRIIRVCGGVREGDDGHGRALLAQVMVDAAAQGRLALHQRLAQRRNRCGKPRGYGGAIHHQRHARLRDSHRYPQRIVSCRFRFNCAQRGPGKGDCFGERKNDKGRPRGSVTHLPR
jgi:hypothetical protein